MIQNNEIIAMLMQRFRYSKKEAEILSTKLEATEALLDADWKRKYDALMATPPEITSAEMPNHDFGRPLYSSERPFMTHSFTHEGGRAVTPLTTREHFAFEYSKILLNSYIDIRKDIPTNELNREIAERSAHLANEICEELDK